MGRRVRRVLRASSYPCAFALSGLVVWQGSQAAFSTETFADDPAAAPAQSSNFRPTLLAPGRTGEQCFVLTAPQSARLYLAHTKAAADLANYLWLQIDVGTGGSAQACAGFRGAAVMSGTLARLSNSHTDYATGSAGPVDTHTTAQTCRVSYRLAANAPSSVSGESVATTFVWEVQGAGSA